MTDGPLHTLLHVAREDGIGAAAEPLDLGQRVRSLRKGKKDAGAGDTKSWTGAIDLF